MLLADYQSYVDCQQRVSDAYRDRANWTRMSILNSARVGRFSSSVEGLQTPYLMPQENGARTEVRWAEVGALRLEGRPHFELTVRPWTSEALAAAKHPPDLVPDPEWVWVNADLAQQGLGSASCGPGVLPQYRLTPGPSVFGLVFRAG